MRELPCFSFCDEKRITVKWMTHQASRRLARRGMHPFDVIYLLYHGRMWRRGGARLCSLTLREVPPDHRKLEWVRRLLGTTLLVSADESVLLSLSTGRQAGRIRKRNVTYYRPRLRNRA
jgi:hypothetical protein